MAELKDRQIRLVHELMYQIKVHQVMNRNVVSLPSTATMREVQLCMKEKKFSGVPIVDNGNLAGIISIDDIITAFDHGYIEDQVGKHMTKNVMTIPQNYSVITATNIFKKYHFGRIPVVKAAGTQELVGIVTYGDILSHLLMQVNAIAEHFETIETLSKRDQSQGNVYRFEIVQDNFDLAGVASTTIKKYLQDRKILPDIVRRIAIICYEAEMNVIIHSLGGYMEVQIQDDLVKIVIVDEGPGIPDLEKAMEPGFTTANEKIRSLGFGAGLGLPNMKSCADKFSIRSSMETGTEIEAIVYTVEHHKDLDKKKT
ncbi:MAG TPA: histidine kinase [Lentisphaeria bacterium]|nr:MAG: hypothetical protein A2X48_20020 [Lentisphaerae bacterium GWF2_49_21]HBC86246.1 histidine kinase [Lentisphaeria bacterium]